MDLNQALFEKKPLIQNKKEILMQLLSALDYIHGLGILHLDLKPKNIMFETESCKKIYLLDFGIAKFQNYQETEMMGMSPHYSAPEVYLNIKKSLVSQKSDIFSFGIILYEFMTGKRAWQKHLGKGNEFILNLIRGNFDFFAENDETGNKQLNELILQCVSQEPEARPTAKKLIDEITRIKLE